MKNLNPESSILEMPLLQGYEYPIDDLEPLHDLLSSWRLEFLYQTLLDQLIDMKVLSIMKSEHVNELLNEFPLGIKILFNHYLENWQNTQNVLSNKINTKSVHEESAFDININLSDILTTSSTGTMIIDYYKTNNKFNDNIRSLLVETVINYIITKKIPMSVNLANYFGNQIVKMFPSEVKDTYFMKNETNKSPKGKLYAKYYNSIRSLKTSGLIPSNDQAKVPGKSLIHVHFEPETGIEYILDQIMHDKSCSFSDLKSNWRATTNYRLNEIQNTTSISEILNKWSSFKLPFGYRLIDIDFCTLHPNCPNLLSTFEDKSKKVMDLLNEKIKDITSRILFESLKNSSNINQNGKNTVLFYLLHAIFVPTSKKVTKDDNGKKSLVKYSIKDSQNSFIVFKNSVDEIEDYITCHSKEKNPIQPCILIVGTPIDPKEILICFHTIKYKVFSIVNAIDVCFKIFHLFNLEYPSQSCIVWIFIQRYFYSLTTKFDKPCHMLGQILSDLSKN
ncbi:Hypothetical protein CINCED_3A016863 [Cinara cedri]|uniref:Uncharacterized protein n=1 Tax=Cinara cedri TaxID=506608 RepID=A0A5E4NCV5_9HEMI|nr:Hypothetical protein CINCED_3A016863 [Cinara cedri]